MTRKTEVKMEEKINLDLVKSTMTKLNLENEFESGIYDTLDGLRKKIKKNTISVKYDFSKVIKDREYGRLYPTKGVSNYCCVNFNIRSYFAREYYKYIDLSCCHANILRDLAIHYKIKGDELIKYCSDRDYYLKEYGISKKTINEQCNNSVCYQKHTFFINIFNIIYGKEGILKKSIETEYFKPLWDSIKDTEPNKEGKFIALMCQTYEARIIQRAINHLVDRKMPPNSYIYDGLLLKKEYNIDLDILNEYLNFSYLEVPMTPVFKNEDFEISKQFQDIFNREAVRDAPDDLDSETEDIMTDDEIADAILKEHKGEVINNRGTLYAYYKHFWNKDVAYVFEIWTSICNLNIVRNPKQKPRKVGSLTQYWEKYKRQMINKVSYYLPIVDYLDKSCGEITFTDGVYNLATKEFTRHEDYGVRYSTLSVRREFPTDTSKIEEIKSIILDIFNGNEEKMTEFLNFLARSLGKHVTDKLALLLVGERNSGKGVLISLLEQSLAGVCGNLLSGDIISKKGSFESAERKNGCLAPVCNNLICFSQEIDPKGKFDGAIWRTLVSGGDEVSFRLSYSKLEVKNIQASVVFTSNVVISFDQANSSDTLLVCNMPCQYREDIPDDNTYRGYTIKQANPKIKEILKEKNYIDAFTLFLFDYYVPDKPNYQILKEEARLISEIDDVVDTSENLQMSIKDLYIICPNTQNSVPQTDVHRVLKSISSTYTPAKIAGVLEAMGVKKVKGHKIRKYEGIAVKDGEPEELDFLDT